MSCFKQLDAKNSPLALLAKTCSNIGKDDSAKSIIPPIEKSDKRETSKSTSPGNRKSPPSDRDRVAKSPENAMSDRFKLESKDIRSPRRNDVISPRKISELSPRQHQQRENSPKSPLGGSHSKLDIKGSTDSKISLNCGSLSLEINHKETNSTSSSAHVTSSPPSTSSSYAHSLSSAKLPHLSHPASLLSAYYPHLALPGYPALPGLHPALAGAEAAALMAAQRPKTDSAVPHIATSYNPVKTASGATTLVPVCSDPYCVSCKLAMQQAQLAAPPCGAGCTQCPRDKSAHSLHALSSAYPASAALGLPGLHSLSSLYGGHHHSAGSSLPSATPHSNQPYVCSWMASTGVCGKRFAYSDDLMQHLRTHTTALDDAHAPSATAAAALAGGSYSSLPPNFTSAALLRQAYDSRLSALNLLSSSSSASRYHPYMKSLTSLHGRDAAALSAMHPATALGPYASLYSLYGHKLGVP